MSYMMKIIPLVLIFSFLFQIKKSILIFMCTNRLLIYSTINLINGKIYNA